MGMFTNIMLLYLCLAVATCLWQPQIVLGNGPQAETVLSFFNVGIDSSGNASVSSADWSNSTSEANSRLLSQGRTTTKDASPINIFLNIIDVAWNCIVYIGLFFRALFSPLIILMSPAMAGIPSYLILALGLPLVFMGLMGIIQFVRGVN